MTNDEKKKRVVVGVDGSDASRYAVEWAADYAQHAGAALEVHTAYSPGYEFVTRQEVRKMLGEIADEAVARAKKCAPDVPVTAVVHEEWPTKALLKGAQGADLLVVGSRGHGELGGMLIGSVSLHASMHAPCSVVVVRPPEQ